MATLDGIKVKLGSGEYIVPPLSLRALKNLGPKLKMLTEFNGVPNEEQTDALLDVIHSALARNYPNVTRDELADMVDLGNLLEVFPAVLAVSGLKQKAVSGGSGEQSEELSGLFWEDLFGLLCTGLKKFPHEVGNEMSLPEALMLAGYWERHPAILYGAGALPIGDSDSGSQTQTTQSKKPKYTTRAEVEDLVRQHGPKKVA